METYITTITGLLAFTQVVRIAAIATGNLKPTKTQKGDILINLAVIGWGIYLLAQEH